MIQHYQRFVDIAFSSLCLANTQIGDKGLAHLSGTRSLKYLDLGHTRVSDAGLAQLANLLNLETLLINDTQVTEAGMAKTRRLLPKLDDTKNKGGSKRRRATFLAS